METQATRVHPLVFLFAVIWNKAKSVLGKGLGIVGIALWCVLCLGFLFRFVALAFNTGWSGADWLIAWTSKLFR